MAEQSELRHGAHDKIRTTLECFNVTFSQRRASFEPRVAVDHHLEAVQVLPVFLDHLGAQDGHVRVDVEQVAQEDQEVHVGDRLQEGVSSG